MRTLLVLSVFWVRNDACCVSLSVFLRISLLLGTTYVSSNDEQVVRTF